MIGDEKGKNSMKYPIRGWIRSVLAVALCFVMALCFISCNFGKEEDGSAFDADDLLKAEGEFVKNRRGETVCLRGVNAGGLFVTENWMNGFQTLRATADSPAVRDFKTISKVFIERFGLEGAQELWKAYQENWWSEIDFENCAAMGMNCIRLPFTYMTVDFDSIVSYDNAGDYDFSPLDRFIEKAASYGMYTILDMHGAYDSQNGQDHSGETKDSAGQVDFYTNSRMIGLTADLWAALAEHYKDNPAVAGYDILNEPGEKAGLTSELHFAVFDRIYDAIREKDQNHMVIFESCWDGKDLPRPSEYGWENCMYSFHHYTSLAEGGQFTEHALSWNEKIAGVTKMNFGVPLQMGEFNNYNDPEQWTYVLGLLNRAGWHWTDWTYKLNNANANSAWGIYTVPVVDNADKVNALTDSYEEIIEKFSKLKTTESIHKVDLGSVTLESIMEEYCSAPVMEHPLAAGGYLLYDSLTDMPIIVSGGGPVLYSDANAGQNFTVAYHSDGDGSVTISSQGGYWSVSDGKVRIASSGQGNAARFYPVETEYGYAFISFTTGRYLRFGGDGTIYADAKTLGDGAIFYCK